MNYKSFYIKTLGCKVNQYESQAIREIFLKTGYIESETGDDSDILIINTCTVTSASDSKSFRLIRNAVKKNNKRIIVTTGCMVEDNDLDFSKLKGVSFIIKNKDKLNIPHIIEKNKESGNEKRFSGISHFKGHTRAFIKIQDGCNNLCSYCKVRLVRGPSRSRLPGDIIDEAGTLIKNGSKEIVLTGICLGSYGRDLSKGIDLQGLIRELCKIPGEWRLRLSSIEPKDVTVQLIDEIKSQSKVCKHLHMPFQSGDNSILKSMNRPYKVSHYIDIANKLRSAIPDVSITTDIMVGFPGETEQNFRNTINFIKEVKPMRIHIFPFSKRKGTPAYTYRGGIENSVKKKREAELLALGEELSRAFINKFAGKTVQVLIEGNRTEEGYLAGYTDRYIKVSIDGPDTLKSRLITGQLTLTNPNSCGILLTYSS